MATKHCGFCDTFKGESEFTLRKTPPIQLYKYCNDCIPLAYPSKRNNAQLIKQDFAEMRAKAIELRKFSPAQDVEIYRRVKAGTTRKAIAAEVGCSSSAVGKAYNRGRSIDFKSKVAAK